MSHDPTARERAEQIARSVLGEQIGVVEATRAILPLLHSDCEIASPDDYNLFRGIDSETDDLPIGNVREEWDPAVLQEKDREIARCENLWREQVRNACERILLRSSRIQ
jgi:hypothetical protein